MCARIRRPPPGMEAALRRMAELRRWTRRVVWRPRSHRERRRWVVRAWRRIGLPTIVVDLLLVLPRQALATLKRAGREVREAHGIPRYRQLWQVLTAAVRWGVYPREYYMHRLYIPERWPRAPLYLGTRRNGESLVAAVGRRDPQQGKREFYERCRSEGLPVAPILAEASPDVPPVIHDPDSVHWEGDLFSKPSGLGAGSGVRWWRRQEGGGWRDGDVTARNRQELLDILAEERWGSPYIVQPKLVTHPAVADLTTGGLCTVRMNTVRDPGSGEVEPLFALFRMPRGAAGDNIALGGIGAGVELETGRLRPALGGATDHLPVAYDRHPDTDAAIVGRVLPQWDELVELARRVHAAFPQTPSGGWDIGVTEDGPMLVEANDMWGCDLMQATNDLPMGLTPYPRVMLKYIKAAATRRALERRL